MIINHNLPAMNAMRMLNMNTQNTQKSIEKLSSGLRINRAGDDAAGLAISEKMRGQIRGLDQATRNSQDGISMIQTAEGALNETHDILQRMRELAVQSSSDTNTASDRANLQKETDQLAKEITRISNTTEFNTQNLLNGGIQAGNVGAATFQIGSNAGQNVSLEIHAMDAQSLGVARNTNSSNITSNGANITSVEADNGIGSKLANGNYQIVSTNIAAGATVSTSGATNTGTPSAATLSGAITGAATANTTLNLTYSATISGTAVETGSFTTAATSSGAVTFTSGGAGFTANGAYTLTFVSNGTSSSVGNANIVRVTDSAGNYVASGTITSGTGAGSVTFSGLTINIAANGSGYGSGDSFQTSVTATQVSGWSVTGSATGRYASGSTINVNGISISTSALGGASVGDSFTVQGYGGATSSLQLQNYSGVNIGNAVLADKTNGGTYTLGNTTTGQLSVTVSPNTVVSGATIVSVATNASASATFANGQKTADAVAAGGIDISTQSSANAAITVINNAIQKVSTERSNLGAYQNRLEHTINNLGTSSENLTGAESRIRDVDMAKEMMNQTKNNILAQAAQSMLAQANQSPQGVLKLLG